MSFFSPPTPPDRPVRELSIAEILRKVQRIELTASRSVTELFAGQYKSAFRGRGMEFDEVRPYQPGDDVRSIDWNVTARTGEPFIKRFSEERELTVLFLVDISASGLFGTTAQAKLDRAVEVAALLMVSALKNNDKVGLLTFCDDVVRYDPPRKGRSHVLRLIRDLVDVHPIARPTRLERPLEFLNRVQKRRAVTFLLSDFLDPLPRRALGITRRRHDLTAVRVIDPRESALPAMGIATFRDAETGELVEVDTGSRHVREAFEQHARRHERSVSEQLTKLGIEQLTVETRDDATLALRKFFARR